MGKCKTKALQADSSIFKNILASSGIFSNYSSIFTILCNLVYTDPWSIRTLAYLEPEAYSEPCQTSTMELFAKKLTAVIIFTDYNLAISAFHVLYFIK